MSVRFVTHRSCPFAHKVWLALECAEIPYTMEEIALYGPQGKPDWFWKLNPRGTVPVLVFSDASPEGCTTQHVYTDSDDILDALLERHAEILEGPNPGDHAARCSKWRTLVNQQLLPAGKRAVLQSDDRALRQVLDQMEAQLQDEYGAVNDDRGIFLGQGPSGGVMPGIADCHALPFVWRLEEEFHLLTEQYPLLRRWFQTCEEYPAIRRTLPSSSSFWWWWW